MHSNQFSFRSLGLFSSGTSHHFQMSTPLPTIKLSPNKIPKIKTFLFSSSISFWEQNVHFRKHGLFISLYSCLLSERWIASLSPSQYLTEMWILWSHCLGFISTHPMETGKPDILLEYNITYKRSFKQVSSMRKWWHTGSSQLCIQQGMLWVLQRPAVKHTILKIKAISLSPNSCPRHPCTFTKYLKAVIFNMCH